MTATFLTAGGPYYFPSQFDNLSGYTITGITIAGGGGGGVLYVGDGYGGFGSQLNLSGIDLSSYTTNSLTIYVGGGGAYGSGGGSSIIFFSGTNTALTIAGGGGGGGSAVYGGNDFADGGYTTENLAYPNGNPQSTDNGVLGGFGGGSGRGGDAGHGNIANGIVGGSGYGGSGGASYPYSGGIGYNLSGDGSGGSADDQGYGGGGGGGYGGGGGGGSGSGSVGAQVGSGGGAGGNFINSIIANYTQVAYNPNRNLYGSLYGSDGFVTITYTYSSPSICFLADCDILLSNLSTKNITLLTVTDEVLGYFSQVPQKIKTIIKNTHDVHSLPNDNTPHHIRKNAFGENIPDKDIHLSGHHRIIFSSENSVGTFDKNFLGIQAFKLNNCEKVLNNPTEVTYYHVILENENEGLIVNNLPVESCTDVASN